LRRRKGETPVKTWLGRWVLACALAAAGGALADEDTIRRALAARMPGMAVESVTRMPFLGLYEVVIDGEIVYTDAKAEYFFSGSIYDVRTLPPRNLTEDREQRAAAGILARAAPELGIKRVWGEGRRVLYTFEDPNCSFCKALHKELARLGNVTVYTFATPILSQSSVDKSVAALCAADRARAWDTLMAGGALPAPGAGCAHPLRKLEELARRFEVTSTPVIFLGDGRRINGFLAADRLEAVLAAPK
jgi:thiol:disulfide interchange protein DsbC